MHAKTFPHTIMKIGHGQPPKPLWKWCAVITVATGGCVIAVGLAAYLFWTPVGFGVVAGLQGRYFIPIAAPIMMLIPTLSSRPPKWTWTHWTDRARDVAYELVAAAGAFYALHLVYVAFFVP